MQIVMIQNRSMLNLNQIKELQFILLSRLVKKKLSWTIICNFQISKLIMNIKKMALTLVISQAQWGGNTLELIIIKNIKAKLTWILNYSNWSIISKNKDIQYKMAS